MAWATVSRYLRRPAPERAPLAAPLRSLSVKLTLAFLLVGLIGASLVALLLSFRTRSEFDRFLSTRDQATLVQALSQYYAANGSWAGVETMLSETPPLNYYSRTIVLTDADGVVVRGNRGFTTGKTVPQPMLDDSVAVQVGGKTVGRVLAMPPPPPGNGPSPDALFLQRLAWASALSAAIAGLIALLLGVLLARTLTQPVRELTAATQAMAGGRLGQRVAVRSHDEIGVLAASFNQMSTDLAQASQARRQMTADLAHDLRTPLSILRGYTEGLKDGQLQGSPKLYAIMHGEVEHLQRLVEDLRVLSLADAGELSLNRRTLDPSALLERTGLAYIVQAEQQGLQLRVETPEDLPSVSVDTDRMTQVLNNLVSNALRHTAEGEVVLAASAVEGRVALSVRDTGGGIAADDLPFVFERFYRGDKARQRTDSSSSGLGLAIAKAIVEAHGGTISAESAPGAGTTITIRLAAVPAHAG